MHTESLRQIWRNGFCEDGRTTVAALFTGRRSVLQPSSLSSSLFCRLFIHISTCSLLTSQPLFTSLHMSPCSLPLPIFLFLSLSSSLSLHTSPLETQRCPHEIDCFAGGYISAVRRVEISVRDGVASRCSEGCAGCGGR